MEASVLLIKALGRRMERREIACLLKAPTHGD